jgi:hypothetical protein
MNSEYPNSSMSPFSDDESQAPSSRLQDEKISDDSGTEAKTNSALAPAGLKNPFWSKAS